MRDEISTDIYNAEKRSEIMSRVRAKDTKPEMVVRSTLHKAGYRFRLHRKDLPGRPDLVLSRYKTVVLIHGCFWHQHEGCRKATLPVKNADFWREKLQGNHDRDKRNKAELERLGWKVFVIWECTLKQGIETLIAMLEDKDT